MDNQQERLHFNIGYLLGQSTGRLISTIQVDYGQEEKRWKRGISTPQTSIFNSDPRIITRKESSRN